MLNSVALIAWRSVSIGNSDKCWKLYLVQVGVAEDDRRSFTTELKYNLLEVRISRRFLDGSACSGRSRERYASDLHMGTHCLT
jgi:hypothetical protein